MAGAGSPGQRRAILVTSPQKGQPVRILRNIVVALVRASVVGGCVVEWPHPWYLGHD
jgi:hypothetical protein